MRCPSLVPPSYRATAIAAVLLAALTAGCGSQESERNVAMGVPFEKEGTLQFLSPVDSVLGRIDVEIADTPAERRQGLMYRRELASDHGMLFIFPRTDQSGFWMKNTYVPLDIIFVGPDSQVVSVAQRTRIMSEETIRPEGPKKFVVEVNSGYSRRHGIDTTTRIRWTRTEPATTSWTDRLWSGIRSLVGG